MNILKPRLLIIYQILIFSSLKNPSSNLNFRKIHIQISILIINNKTNFRHRLWLLILPARKNNIRTLFRPYILITLLSQNPQNRIQNITLSTPVRPDNRSNPIIKLYNSSICKRFKPCQLQCF